MGRAFRIVVWAVWAIAAALLATPRPLAAEESLSTAGISRASDAVVGVISVAVEDASSSATLGPVRRGSGVVIGPDGLVLTIGYLIVEADQVQLLTDAGRHVPARVVGYDVATGFGLVQALIPLGLQPAPMGDPAQVHDEDTLLVISGGEDAGISMARRVSQRAFSGYWEYHLDHALFTAPARTDHSGAALFNLQGELLGVGSLFVGDALGPGQPPMHGNMFVPIDLLKPILAELITQGRSAQSRRAWIGVNCIEIDGEVRVLRVNSPSPAETAGLQPGDRIVRIDGQAVDNLDTLWHRLWSGGAVERDVALDIQRNGRAMRVPLRTVDRQSTLKQPAGT
ncbi:S1C family serine protease [Ideonella sp.]|uniref:S1C family serine protease n=1 Tax=Ideonella sp. TaxID=1929293 RepID=UPI002B48CC86|nr:S1C family serine protease [Ideonella sp.]HJV70441.1 S1C family serine protease [Ideonella sp.]